MRQKDDVVHDYRSKRYASVAEGLDGLEVIYGNARFEAAEAIVVKGRRIEGDRNVARAGRRTVGGS